ncbi:MAG: dihydrodipicolinate reductase [Desulfobacterales bacterium]|nr:MAG: dihydrodipicolinate reductase [Desulfobacterales bacterium]
MDRIKVMVNGLPGNMAATVARHIMARKGYELIPYALTGPEIETAEYRLDPVRVRLIRPEVREQVIYDILESHGSFLSVDYTHPAAVNGNAEFYCQFSLPFVMGTTGGDRRRLLETVKSSNIAAVIAPNMAKQIVGFQAMMEFAAHTFPDLFKGYSLEIKESHQAGKADTSGTAKAMIGYFNRLGTPVTEEDIVKERDPAIQQSRWGIPPEHLKGHGWHTYSLVSADRTVRFEFTHNVNGREIYAQGTLDALAYLAAKLDEGARGKVFTMLDVLKGR